MQRRALWTVAPLLTLAVFSSGCNDLGSCDDPAKGRTTVTIGGQFYFTGQAIITQACATGCHASGVKGKGRNGAPAGLDFDLRPLAPGPVIYGDGGVPSAVEVDPKQLAGLRARQRKVYEEREQIWEQVDKGLMPPAGFKGFEMLRIVRAAFGAADMKCTAGAALTTLSAHKEELRNWLACDTPVVEATSDELPYKMLPENASAADKAAGSGYYATAQSVGYQYPTCDPGDPADPDGGVPQQDGGPPGEGGVVAGPTFADLYKNIFEPQCSICHTPGGLNEDIDFSTEAKAYMELLGANGMGAPQSCATNTSPYVTPGDPTKSYLLVKVGAITNGRCVDVMPIPDGLSKADGDKIRAWIMAGAKR